MLVEWYSTPKNRQYRSIPPQSWLHLSRPIILKDGLALDSITSIPGMGYIHKDKDHPEDHLAPDLIHRLPLSAYLSM